MVGGKGVILDSEGTWFMSCLVMINAAQIWNMDFFLSLRKQGQGLALKGFFCFSRGGEELGRVNMKGLSYIISENHHFPRFLGSQ